MSDKKKNPEGKESVYTRREIPSVTLLEIKYEGLLERIRLIEEALRMVQSTIYAIDEDYQLAKHKNRIACMCCPVLRKFKKCKGS